MSRQSHRRRRNASSRDEDIYSRRYGIEEVDLVSGDEHVENTSTFRGYRLGKFVLQIFLTILSNSLPSSIAYFFLRYIVAYRMPFYLIVILFGILLIIAISSLHCVRIALSYYKDFSDSPLLFESITNVLFFFVMLISTALAMYIAYSP